VSRGKPFLAPRGLSVVCADLQRSGRFYQEILGALALPGDGVSQRYQLGSLIIDLVPIAENRTAAMYPRHPMAVLAVEADDLEQAREHFVRSGVAVVQTYGEQMIVVADPDGLPVEVTERVLPADRLKMVRIPAPPWAPQYARGRVEFHEAGEPHASVSAAEREALLRRRADILALVDREVEEYANAASAPSGQHWFPKRSRLTGEYYIGSESYHRLPGASWCQVCVRARCLGRGAGGPEDYLGLDVWLRYDPAEDQLLVHRNLDSSAI
jgi:catechol 2,3-dioxygenase-like lactoylglutathione lyase family enzyme